VLQIKIHGRGGQGAQMAAQVLATAFFREGKYVQAFASYGGARRGTAVSSYIRIDNRPIRLRCDIENPDAVLIFDASLIDEKMLKGINKDTSLLINSTKEAKDLKECSGFKVYTIDGINIASRNGLGRIVNSVLLGALAGLLDAPDFKNMQNVIEEMSPVKVPENISSFRDGYELAKKFKGVA